MQVILSDKEKKFTKFIVITAILLFITYKLDKD